MAQSSAALKAVPANIPSPDEVKREILTLAKRWDDRVDASLFKLRLIWEAKKLENPALPDFLKWLNGKSSSLETHIDTIANGLHTSVNLDRAFVTRYFSEFINSSAKSVFNVVLGRIPSAGKMMQTFKKMAASSDVEHLLKIEREIGKTVV